MEYVKLTDKDMRTYNGYQWAVGEKRTVSGAGKLCTEGWLHCYGAETQGQALLLAELLHPLHVGFFPQSAVELPSPGQIRSDSGLKFGATEMTLGEELDPPIVTTVNRVAFGILCAMEVFKDRIFIAWGEGWLSGKDRSLEAAGAAVERAADRAESALAALAATATVTPWSAAWAWSAAERAAAAWSAARAAAAVEEAEAALEAARAARRAVAVVSAERNLPLERLAEKAMEIS